MSLGAMTSQAKPESDAGKSDPQVSKLPPFMSINEVAQFFRISRRTVHRWIVDGKVTRYKAGGRALVDTRSVLRMMEVPGA